MKKNIVIICFKYPPKYSGYGKQLKSVLENMGETRKKIIILTAFGSSNHNEGKINNLVVLGSKFFKSEKLVFYVFCLKTLFWLLFNHKKYSIIHCIKAGPEAIVANFVSKLFRKTLIVKVVQDELSFRELNNVKGPKKLIRKLRQWFLSSVNYYIAISQEISDELHKKVSNKTKILRIPNGVDTVKFSPVSEDIKLELKRKLEIHVDDHPIVLFAGAINRRKGVPDLIDAIEKVERNLKFSIVFCGPKLEDLDFEAKINKITNLNPNITVYYRGVVSNINEYMKISDIFVLPSYSEGLPNVLLEAGSAGLALIATDIGGNRDIIQDGTNGFLVPINNPEYLARKLTELILNKRLRDSFGTNARKYVVDNFSLDKISKTYEELYNNIL